MSEKPKTYLCIDLKSFYASVECVERGLNPLTTNLVVADESRTQKTICLAVSPSLKMYGLPGRPRLFEVYSQVRDINRERRKKAYKKQFTGKSSDFIALQGNPNLEIGFIVAEPRMQFYMDYSDRIYNIYQRYVSQNDIHVYSIDEVFMDITDYLHRFNGSAHEMAMTIIRSVLAETGITATAGIGTNMYLAKVAMDIVAKHVPADADGVRIAELDEYSYREKLWDHQPLRDFWRIGNGIYKRLDRYGLHTMGDVARFSIENSPTLFKEFGINAELLIDHAWGYEPCTIKEIKSYVPQNNSLSSGQVLREPYPYDKAEIIVREMTDALALSMVAKGVVTDQLGLMLNYDTSNITDEYDGEVAIDYYGRTIPRGASSSINLGVFTSSSQIMTDAMIELFHGIADRSLSVRRVTICANRIFTEEKARDTWKQLDLFADAREVEKQDQEARKLMEKDKKAREAIIKIREKFGKNAVIKGTSLQEGATGRERNRQVGGHKS